MLKTVFLSSFLKYVFIPATVMVNFTLTAKILSKPSLYTVFNLGHAFHGLIGLCACPFVYLNIFDLLSGEIDFFFY